MLNNFIYAKEKSLFEEKLNNGEVLDEAIVFIEDTKEIWNHETYFDCSSVDLSGIETSIQNIIDTYATKTEIPTKLSQLENDAAYVSEQQLQLEVIPENGIYAVKSNGELCPVNQADESCIAIALVTDDQKIMIERDGDNNPEWYNSYGNKFYWSSELYTRDVPNISNVSDPLTDFNGKLNTEALLNAYTEFGVSIHDYDIINILNNFNSNSESNKGYSDWYIPSAGQLYQIMQNYEQINEALLQIGGGFLQGISWSSSEYNANQGYGSYMNNVDDFGINSVDKYVMRSLRLVRDLSITKSIKNVTSDLLTTINNLEKDAIKICKASWLNDLDFDAKEGPLTQEQFDEVYAYDAIENWGELLLRTYRDYSSITFKSIEHEQTNYNTTITFYDNGWYQIEYIENGIITIIKYPVVLDSFSGENWEDFELIRNVYSLDCKYRINDVYNNALFTKKSENSPYVIFTGSLELDGVIKFYDLYITETTWELREIKIETELGQKWNVLDESFYTYLDLGLPSGTLWATCNVGATIPGEPGLYYQWGDTQGYTYNDVQLYLKQFNEDDYKYNNQVYAGGVYLNAAENIAYSYNSDMTMPTEYDFQELLENTTQTETILNGRKVFKFTSKINGISLYIPKSGLIDDGRLVNNSTYLLGINADKFMGYDDVNHEWGVFDSNEFFGYNVRPIKRTETISDPLNKQYFFICNHTYKPLNFHDGDSYFELPYNAEYAQYNCENYIPEYGIKVTVYKNGGTYYNSAKFIANCYWPAGMTLSDLLDQLNLSPVQGFTVVLEYSNQPLRTYYGY